MSKINTVYKYEITDYPMQLPRGAKILSVGLDREGLPCLWAQVPVGETVMVERDIMIVPTGGVVGDKDIYLGTIFDLPYVWHIYEVKDGEK